MIIAILIVLGLCFGSFVNALIYRLHEQSLIADKQASKKLSKKQAKQQTDALSISTGRSMCPNCKHELSAKDLVPVVSWLLLRGKCRYCSKPIPDTPVSELLTPALFVLSYFAWPLPLHGVGQLGLGSSRVYFAFWLVFIVGFVALAIYDLRWYILPNRIVFPLVGVAVLELIVRLSLYHEGWQALLGALWGILIASGIFYVLFQLSDGKWIGGGDVKLGLVLGLLVGGPSRAFLLLFTASLVGTLVALPFLLTGRMKRTSKLPFGPFLLIATFIVVLWGGSLISWYTRQVIGA